MSKKDLKIEKKLQKQQYKLEKRRLQGGQSPPSLYVRFAESIKGILYIVIAVSMFAAVIMGQSGLILTLEEIIDNLIIARLGKILTVVIAVALLLFGLKTLRILK